MCRSISLLLLILLFGLAFEAAGQSLLKNNKIPDDLLIILKHQSGAGYGWSYSEMSINAFGDFSYISRSGGLPKGVNFDLIVPIINGKPGKPPKYLKSKLSQAKLVSLLAEFERIQFFRFGPDFPPGDPEGTSIGHSDSETISIRVNGHTKEVSNDLGGGFRRTDVQIPRILQRKKGRP